MNSIQIVLPGDDLTAIISPKFENRVVLGPGLRKEPEKIISTKCGVLCHRKPNIYYVDFHHKRYIPAKGDTVIGIITVRGGDNLRLDIGSNEQAQLSLLAFEGATKRNKPMVQVGDIIFGQVLVGNKDTEPELVCVDKHGKKGCLGPLSNDGFMFTVPLNLVRKLLSPNCPFLDITGRMFKYEITLGINGRIWIKAGSVKNTLLLYNAILLAEHMSADDIAVMSATIFQTV